MSLKQGMPAWNRLTDGVTHPWGNLRRQPRDEASNEQMAIERKISREYIQKNNCDPNGVYRDNRTSAEPRQIHSFADLTIWASLRISFASTSLMTTKSKSCASDVSTLKELCFSIPPPVDNA